MAKQIANPTVRFGGSMGGLMAQIDRLQGRLGQFAGAAAGFGARFAKLGAKLGVIGTAVGGVIGAIAGAGLGILVKQQLDAIDSSAKLADRLGMSTQALEGLTHAAGLSGASQETLNKSIEKMLKNVGQAATDGVGPAAEALEQLGMNAKDVASMGTEEAFLAIGDALGKIENPAKRAFLATEIFGRSGQELLPTFAAGADGIRSMMNEADALGLAFNRADAAKVEAANDAFSRMQATITGVIRSITVAVAPAITAAADHFTAFGIRVVAAVKAVLPTIISTVSSVLARVRSIVVGFIQWITPAVSAIWGFIRRHVGTVVGMVASVVDAITGMIGAAIDWLTPYWNAAWEWMTSVFAARVQSLIGYGLAIWETIKAVMNGIWSVVTSLWDATLGHWLGAMGGMSGATDSALTGIGKMFVWLSDTCQWVLDQITLALRVLTFGINNIGAVFDLVGTTIAHAVVKIGNQIHHVFTEVIPAVLTWFGENWKNLLTDWFNLSTTIWGNLGSNIVEVMSNLPGLISGSVAFADLWTPITEGFESTLSELPDIAARQVGEMEQSLADSLARQRDDLGQGLGEYLAEQERRTKQTMSNITGFFEDATGAVLQPGIGDAPELEVKMPGLASMAGTPWEGGETGSDGKIAAPSLVNAFSAESMARRFGESVSLAMPNIDGAMPSPPKEEDEQTKVTKELRREAAKQTSAQQELVRLQREQSRPVVVTIA